MRSDSFPKLSVFCLAISGLRKSVLLFCGISVLIITSCKTHLSPSTIPHYGFTEANQMHVNASLGYNGIETQAAVSLSDRMYMSAYYLGAKYGETTRYRMYGMGLGRYKTLDKRGRLSSGLELYYGNIGARDIPYDNYRRDKVFRFLANTSIGTEFKLIEIYTGIRLGNYSYFQIPNSRDISLRFEPNITLKVGPGRFKLFSQVGMSIPTTGWNSSYPIFQMGLQVETFKKNKN